MKIKNVIKKIKNVIKKIMAIVIKNLIKHLIGKRNGKY
jgi:hypothetical protein